MKGCCDWLCLCVCYVTCLVVCLQQKQPEEEEDPLGKLKNQKIVQCRICKGDHWTTKCPYKDTLAPLQVNVVCTESVNLSSKCNLKDKSKARGDF